MQRLSGGGGGEQSHWRGCVGRIRMVDDQRRRRIFEYRGQPVVDIGVWDVDGAFSSGSIERGRGFGRSVDSSGGC
jgi:hypothetical protein